MKLDCLVWFVLEHSSKQVSHTNCSEKTNITSQDVWLRFGKEKMAKYFNISSESWSMIPRYQQLPENTRGIHLINSRSYCGLLKCQCHYFNVLITVDMLVNFGKCVRYAGACEEYSLV